jgi:hypothetical protein
MKKTILGSLLVTSALMADVTTVLPYIANIKYDTDIKKSAKHDGEIKGFYSSIGNLGYLVEVDYSTTNIKYKDLATSNLKQNDLTVAYAKYYPSYMIKGGIHRVSTTDTDLGDTNVFIGAISGYEWIGYDKYEFGVEGYYSRYKDGHDENGIAKNINISQITPFYKFSQAINVNTSNIVSLKINHILANRYQTTNYTSYELENTLNFKKFFTTLKINAGKMKTGVRDSGHTVYNSKDLYKDAYSIKVGYNFRANFAVAMSYVVNHFEEYGLEEESSTKVTVATVKYSF